MLGTRMSTLHELPCLTWDPEGPWAKNISLGSLHLLKTPPLGEIISVAQANISAYWPFSSSGSFSFYLNKVLCARIEVNFPLTSFANRQSTIS